MSIDIHQLSIVVSQKPESFNRTKYILKSLRPHLRFAMAKAVLRASDIPSLRNKLCDLFGYEPHEEQLKAIKTLAVDQEDLILIARTGFGKSMIFQSIPVLRDGICLVIMPLNLLEDEQVCAIPVFLFLKKSYVNFKNRA